MGGWILRMTWDLKACFTVFHSETMYALSLLTVWSPWGNPEMARCLKKRAIWVVRYIQQHSWRAIMEFAGEWAQRRFPDQNCQPKFYAGDMITPVWPSFLVWSLPWYCIIGTSSVTNKQKMYSKNDIFQWKKNLERLAWFLTKRIDFVVHKLQ